MSYVPSSIPLVSLEPHPVGPLMYSGRNSIPEVRTALTPFMAPIPIHGVPLNLYDTPQHLPYVPLRGMGAGPDGLGALGVDVNVNPLSTGEKVLLGAVVLGVLAGVGWLIYKKVQLTQTIAEKEGAKGVLALEAGEVGLGLLSAAGHKAFERNKPRRRRRRHHPR